MARFYDYLSGESRECNYKGIKTPKTEDTPLPPAPVITGAPTPNINPVNPWIDWDPSVLINFLHNPPGLDPNMMVEVQTRNGIVSRPKPVSYWYWGPNKAMPDSAIVKYRKA